MDKRKFVIKLVISSENGSFYNLIEQTDGYRIMKSVVAIEVSEGDSVQEVVTLLQSGLESALRGALMTTELSCEVNKQEIPQIVSEAKFWPSRITSTNVDHSDIPVFRIEDRK